MSTSFCHAVWVPCRVRSLARVANDIDAEWCRARARARPRAPIRGLRRARPSCCAAPFDRVFQHAADADVAELTRLARTIDHWREQILNNHHTSGASNGPTAAVNLLIEKTRRIGHGHRNFTNYRRRLLLGYGINMDYRPNPQNPRPPHSVRRVESR